MELEELFDLMKACIGKACLERDYELVGATAEGLLMNGGTSARLYEVYMDYECGDAATGDRLELRMRAHAPQKYAGTPLEEPPVPGCEYSYDFELRIRGRRTRKPHSDGFKAPAPSILI